MNLLKQLTSRIRRFVFRQQPKEQTVENEPFVYTEEQLMARLKFFIGICLAMTLTGIVFVVLYSLIFVTQPLNAMSPIDQKFFELIVPIATFLTGTLSGIMLAGTKPEDKEAMLAAQKNAQIAADSAKTPPPKTDQGGFGGGSFNFPAGSGSGFGTTSPGFGAVPPAANSFGAQPFGSSNSFAASPVQSWGVTNIATTASGKKIVPEEEQPLR
jgi:hypothetical protein